MDQFFLVIKLLLGLYGVLLLVIFLTQCSMVYYPNLPSREIVATPEQNGLTYENVELTTTDQQTINGWFIPADLPSDRPVNTKEHRVLLFFHGNAGNISHRLDSIGIFLRLGLSVFIIDYRGYGKSSGKPSEQGTYLDADAALSYLVNERNIPMDNIIYFGRSLGGAVASHLAVKHPPKALILESTFTSAPDMAARLFPIFPMRWLTRFSYSNINNIKNIHCPVLIVHSSEDDIIPFELGRALFAAANEPKQFLEIHGDHNEGFIQSRQIYIAGLKRFLESAAHSQ